LVIKEVHPHSNLLAIFVLADQFLIIKQVTPPLKQVFILSDLLPLNPLTIEKKPVN
jgi:hypothetical protein